jgi:hypothetical protein
MDLAKGGAGVPGEVGHQGLMAERGRCGPAVEPIVWTKIEIS